MIAYITKYALTEGILEKEGHEFGTNGFFVPGVAGKSLDMRFYGVEWHTTKDKAIAKAEDMRKNKIASLKRQIAKLEALTF